MSVKVTCFISFLVLASSVNGFKKLFPQENRLYAYRFQSNVYTGTESTESFDWPFWNLEGTISVQLYDDFGKARFSIDDLKNLTGTYPSEQTEDAVTNLKKPWEVDKCFSIIYVHSEPVWVTNIKRAISFNFLFSPTAAVTSSSSVDTEEPCLYGNCEVTYMSGPGNKTVKHLSRVDYKKSGLSTYEANCLPLGSSEWNRPYYYDDPRYTMTADREYEVDKNAGLKSIELKSNFKFLSHEQQLFVKTGFNLWFESDKAAKSVEKLALNELSMHYTYPNHRYPFNGIFDPPQDDLKEETYNLLLKIAQKGMDADNVVRNASMIHSLDFIELLNKMSQLNVTSLERLFKDVLGTSYELETSRNIFMEVLPYTRTEACAQLIKQLVIEQKKKIEDSVLVSLIRKLPYNIVAFSKSLLQELEVFTKLGPDYPQEIRHAGILSFATLFHKTMEASFDQQYFDEISDKYLRMYNNCPQYLDRLVWLQGLTNIGKNVVDSLDEIHTDNKKDRHERLWAALASLSIWNGWHKLEHILPILRNETEHIQLRAIAVHSILSSRLGVRDFINVHNYMKSSSSSQLKKFWYSSLRSMESNRFYTRYLPAAYYIRFIPKLKRREDLKYWSTNNYIISQESQAVSLDPHQDVQGPSFQLITVGEEWSGTPEMVVMDFSTGGERPFKGALYLIAEGVSSNLFKRFQSPKSTDSQIDDLLQVLQQMQIPLIEPEKVHIDIVIKIQDKTVYATHLDQTKFDSFNLKELKKSIEEFVHFGSHINQQIAYYPTQSVMDFPTELGIPTRVQSTLVTFASIRGNLTAPSSDDLMWRNDLHIRYQGMSVTSLSVANPVQPSEHSTLIQQSMVIHLPIKLDVIFSPLARSFELKWTNPVQNGGVAMHSRVQTSVTSASGTHVNTVPRRRDQSKSDGIYFDCEHPMTLTEILQLLTSRGYNLISSLHPSHIIINAVRLITSPPSGSCGLILPPRQLETGNKFRVELKLEEYSWDDDANETRPQGYDSMLRLKVAYLLSYYRESDNSTEQENFMTITGYAKVINNGKNGSFAVQVNSVQPSNYGNFTLCFKEEHSIRNSSTAVDFSSHPPPSQRHITVNLTSNSDFTCFSSDPDMKLEMNLNSMTSTLDGATRRRWQVEMGGENLPRYFYGIQFIDEPDWMTFLKSIDAQTSGLSSKAYIDIEEDEGMATVSVNGTKEMEMDAEGLSWIPDSWTTLQTLKNLGLYHECRIQGNKVTTFSGTVDYLPLYYYQTLAVAECTSDPRFAVMLQLGDGGLGGGFTVYSGGDSIMYYWSRPGKPFWRPARTNDIRIHMDGNSTRILSSKWSGVHVYHRSNVETVILVPYAYMHSACGACASQQYTIV